MHTSPVKTGSRVNDKEMGRFRNKEYCWDRNLVIIQITPSRITQPQFLKDTDKGLIHIPKLFLGGRRPHQMKTADCKHRDPDREETRRLMMIKNLTLMLVIQQLSTS